MFARRRRVGRDRGGLLGVGEPAGRDEPFVVLTLLPGLRLLAQLREDDGGRDRVHDHTAAGPLRRHHLGQPVTASLEAQYATWSARATLPA